MVTLLKSKDKERLLKAANIKRFMYWGKDVVYTGTRMGKGINDD